MVAGVCGMTITRLTADERLRRLLAAVPWIVEEDGAEVEEVCRRFGYTEAELAEDLNLLFVCGVYPFTPDSLMEAEIDDGRVWIRYADYFARQLRLTPAEALAVLAAGRALLATQGADEAGALARALMKLATTLGVDPEETVDIDLGATDPVLLDTVKHATAEHHPLTFRYYSFGRDEWSMRSVEPNDVYAAGGEWYVRGYDRDRAAERLFRLDRMSDIAVSPDSFAPRTANDRLLYQPGTGDRIVVIDLPKSAWWMVEHYPNISVETIDDETKRLTLSISATAFLERLLLQLGSSVRVEGAEGIAQEAALRILARYS